MAKREPISTPDLMQGNLYSGVPDTLADEFSETLLARPGCRLERIISQGQASPAGQWYDQEGDEWVVLLKGAAALEIEGHSDLVELGAGDYLLLPAHCRHRVAWTSDKMDTVWLALHLGAEAEC